MMLGNANPSITKINHAPHLTASQATMYFGVFGASTNGDAPLHRFKRSDGDREINFNAWLPVINSCCSLLQDNSLMNMLLLFYAKKTLFSIRCTGWMSFPIVLHFCSSSNAIITYERTDERISMSHELTSRWPQRTAVSIEICDHQRRYFIHVLASESIGFRNCIFWFMTTAATHCGAL